MSTTDTPPRNRVRELRLARKMTINQLAAKLGVAFSSLQKIETGSVDLDLTWMSKLSQALRVKPFELLPQAWQPEQIHGVGGNSEDLRDMIEIVEEFLSERKQILTPSQKAELITILLEIAAETPANENIQERLYYTMDTFVRIKTA